MTTELLSVDPVLARFQVYAEAGISRVTFEVKGEQVSAFLRQGKVRALCTCGVESCEHQQLVWSFLGAEGQLNVVEASDARVRSSLRPPAPLANDTILLDALDELLLATARAGVNTPDSVSIRQALEQVVASAPVPPSLTFSRWIGRFNEALASGEVGKVARLLDGARQWLDEQREGDRSPAAMTRRRSWLGQADGQASETLSESVLIEVAREWLNGVSRTSLERRYLADLHTGEVHREERRRGEQDISVGPCPRVVQVAFGELDSAVRPRRLRLLQYTVSPEPSQEQWRRLCEFADQRVEDLARRYAENARACPGLAEPFVLFAPAELEDGGQAALRDALDERVVLVDDTMAPLGDAVRAIIQESELVCVTGRLLGLARGLALRPTSVLVKQAGRFVLRRVT